MKKYNPIIRGHCIRGRTSTNLGKRSIPLSQFSLYVPNRVISFQIGYFLFSCLGLRRPRKFHTQWSDIHFEVHLLIGAKTITVIIGAFIILLIISQIYHLDIIVLITSIRPRPFARTFLSVFSFFILRPFLTGIFALLRGSGFFLFSLRYLFTLLRDSWRGFWVKSLWRHFCSVFRHCFIGLLERG